MTDIELAKFLGHRQKRLQYWRESLSSKLIVEPKAEEIETKLQTYALLLAKLARPGTEAELSDSAERLSKLESELASLFELSRYATGQISRRGGVDTPVMKPK